MKKKLLLLFTLLLFISGATYAQGTWTRVSNSAPNGSGGLMLLLSDGTVMAKSDAGGGSGTVWMKLTPDIHGSYSNGTWSTLASMISDRLYFSSQIMKDGRLYVAGGEYGAGQNLSEIYNPLNNTWTALPATGHTFSDANSEILPDGRILQALVEGGLNSTLIYDPATNQYINGPSSHGIIDESAWVKLKDNSILMVDRDTRNSERYIPSLNQWVVDANLPVDIYDSFGSEAGAAFTLPDGRAFFIGATGSTAYYNPSNNNNPGSWTAGPTMPNGLGAPDAASAMLVNGKILCALSPAPTSANHFPSPTSFYEFNYLTNSFTQVSSPDGGNYATFVTGMLDLPDGTVLYSTQGNTQYYIYSPGGTPLAAGKPTISQVSANDCGGSSYTISGTLFNGISEGAGYGDDWQMASNYPIIRLTNGSNVYYARTYNWNNTGVQTGSAVTNTQFTLPAGLPYATYSLVVTANGISSDPVSFTPSTCNGLVNVYKDCNYSGYAAPLSVGDYTTAQLNALGVLDNDVSSLKVTEGYKIILYDGDNFTGTSTVITSANSCLVGIAWNDITSSIQVRANGVTNMAGVYFLQNRNSGLYMDVWGATNDDGANIAQGGFNGGANQQFQFTHLGDGTYKILATQSMKSMDVSAISTADGANVQQWTYNGTPNQQFILFSTGDGYYKLIPKHSGKLVEVAGASLTSGANVQQYTNNNQTCGQWGLVTPVAVNGTGDGLAGSYFNGMNFEVPRYSRKDAAINFDWGTGSPNASVNSDQFSARWTGQIQPRYSGIYTFYLNSDNGRRLWINNQLVVDKWIDDWGIEYSGTISLNAGQKYDIKMEYFENNGGANCKAEWSSLLQAREVVPQSQLYSNPFPGVSITSPANNTSFNAPASITINATASDNGSVAKVDFYNGSAFLGSDNTSPYSFVWNNVAAGTYALNAIATDNLGAITLSASVNVSVNTVVTNVPPTVSITSPANNASFNAPASVTINANAADSDGTVSKVDFYNGSALLGSDNTAPYSFAWTNVAAGNYSIIAKATDNTGAVTTSATVSIQVVAMIATVYKDCSFGGYAVPLALGNYTLAQMTAQGILDNDISSVKVQSGYQVILYADDNFSGSSLVITADNACVVSNNFNDIASSMKVSLVTINTPPAVSITSPANNAGFNALASITINANASDADGTVSKVDFYNGATLLGSDNTSPYSFAWTNVAAGNYAITAKATDNTGAVTVSAAVNVTVTAVSSLTIQAEAYSAMAGVQTESTSDAGGGLDVGWIDTGDWMAYNSINFPTSGTYTIQYRVASLSGGSLSCDLNAGSIQLGTIAVPATGGWQTWTTISQTVNVNAGTYNFGIYAQAGGWNINWFTITKQGVGRMAASSSDPNAVITTNYVTGISLYPNPTEQFLNFNTSVDLVGAQVSIVNSTGVEMLNLILEGPSVDVSSLPGGIYLIKITKDGIKINNKFVKQ